MNENLSIGVCGTTAYVCILYVLYQTYTYHIYVHSNVCTFYTTYTYIT
jgi:hypothetical protein